MELIGQELIRFLKLQGLTSLMLQIKPKAEKFGGGL